MLLPAAASYEELVAKFSWQIPPRFNIATACVDTWATREPDRVALIAFAATGKMTPTTYGELREISDRLSHALRARGIGRGDRVALLLPQSIETAIAHLAAYKLGAIAVPLAALFGGDALRHRLAISGARVLITDGAGWTKVAAIRDDLRISPSSSAPTDRPEPPKAGARRWTRTAAGSPRPIPVQTTPR